MKMSGRSSNIKRLVETIQRTLQVPYVTVHYMGVYFCGFNVCVSEKRLDFTDVYTVL